MEGLQQANHQHRRGGYQFSSVTFEWQDRCVEPDCEVVLASMTQEAVNTLSEEFAQDLERIGNHRLAREVRLILAAQPASDV